MTLTQSQLRKIISDEVRKGSSPPVQTEPAVDHICHCPKCYSEAIQKMNDTSEFACKTCGLPLGSESFATQLEECPNCHGKDAKKVKE